MAGMENLNSAESREMSAEMMNEDEAVKTISNSKEPDKAVDAVINNSKEAQQTSPESPESKKLRTELQNKLNIKLENSNSGEALKKILKNRTLADIQKMSSVAKANMAQEMACLMFVDRGTDLWQIQSKLDRWAQISPQSLWVWSREELQQYFDQAQDMLKEKTYELFRLFGGINNMPDVSTLATWDGSNTTWIRWHLNLWRLFFAYPKLDGSENFETPKLATTKNYFSIKNPDQDASILIKASWVDEKWGYVKLSFTNPDTNETKNIIVDYWLDWLSLWKDSKIPNTWESKVDVVTQKWFCKINIPSSFADWNMQVETRSNKWSWKNNYDEVSFTIVSENGEVAENKKVYEPFAKWRHELSQASQQRLHDILWNIDWNDSRQMPHKLEISNDSSGYYFSSDADAQKALNTYQSNWNKLYEQIKSKVNDRWSDIQKIGTLKSTIEASIDNAFAGQKRHDKDWKEQPMSPTATKVQKQLAVNRFLESVNFLLQDQKFKEKFISTNNINSLLKVKFKVCADNRYITLS